MTCSTKAGVPYRGAEHIAYESAAKLCADSGKEAGHGPQSSGHSCSITPASYFATRVYPWHPWQDDLEKSSCPRAKKLPGLHMLLWKLCTCRHFVGTYVNMHTLQYFRHAEAVKLVLEKMQETYDAMTLLQANIILCDKPERLVAWYHMHDLTCCVVRMLNIDPCQYYQAAAPEALRGLHTLGREPLQLSAEVQDVWFN